MSWDKVKEMSDQPTIKQSKGLTICLMLKTSNGYT